MTAPRDVGPRHGGHSGDDPGELRLALVDDLERRGILTDANVKNAMLTVERHLFAPGTSIRAAYADEALVIKWSGRQLVSSVSQPTMVVSMLQMLAPERDDRVLEIGTGSGYNAALLSELVGGQGIVVSLEVDPELAAEARRRLDDNGYAAVEVHAADGSGGWPDGAPYDRIVCTAAVPEPSRAWIEQLTDRAKMVVPLSRQLEAVAYEKTGSCLQAVASCPARFVPLRPGTG